MAYPYIVQRISDRYPGVSPDEIERRLRYSSFVNLTKRYLYFEVPKAACTQIKVLLRQHEAAQSIKMFVGGLRETRREMFVHARDNIPLPSLIDLDDAAQEEVLWSSRFLRWTIVRNPYDRLVSAWKNKVLPCEPGCERLYLEIKSRLPSMDSKDLIAFDEFVTYLERNCDLATCDQHWRRQADHVFLRALNYSWVGKVEHLAATLAIFQQHLGLADPIRVGQKNASAPVSRPTYDKHLADRVLSLYQVDFDSFGYDPGSWRDALSSPPVQPSVGVTEERFYDEIIERNIIISSLYRERERLQAALRRVSQLHLLDLANAIAIVRWRWLALTSKVWGWIQSIVDG